MTTTAWVPDLLPAHLLRLDTDPNALGKELLSVITEAIEQQPRSLQTRIGPSEIGHACARRIGYKLMGAPDINQNQGVPWKPFVGTAVHSKLEDIFDRNNLTWAQALGGQERWMVETKVDIGWTCNGEDIDGSCDLYDRVTGTVIDWKCVGPSPLKNYRSKGPGPQYRSQAHTYGRGWLRRGLPVSTVMIVFLPRNGELHETHIWHEAFDEQVAIDAINRADAINTAVKAIGFPVLQQLPTADAYCYRCPYYKAESTDLRQGCPGDPAGQRTQQPAFTFGGKP